MEPDQLDPEIEDVLDVREGDASLLKRRARGRPTMRSGCGWEKTADSMEELIRLFVAHTATCPHHDHE